MKAQGENTETINQQNNNHTMNTIHVTGTIYARDYSLWAYGHTANIRLLKAYDSKAELDNVVNNASGHFHCLIGVFDMVADNAIRETTLYLRDKGLLKQKTKYLAGIARQDVDRWKKQMRSTTLFWSYDAYEAAIYEHIGTLMKDIDMIEMQISQYLTMNGCQDVETCTKVALTYLLIKDVRCEYKALKEAFAQSVGIDFGNTYEHMLLDRAEKAWKELSQMIVGRQADGIENYQPLETAFTIYLRKVNDLDNFMLRVGEAVEEYADNYDEETRREVAADVAKVRRSKAEEAKRIRQETAAARRRQEERAKQRKSTDITDEDLQRLKDRFTA